MVAHREAEKNRIDELLAENKKNVVMPVGIFSKVPDIHNHHSNTVLLTLLPTGPGVPGLPGGAQREPGAAAARNLPLLLQQHGDLPGGGVRGARGELAAVLTVGQPDIPRVHRAGG
jgi:hypothetical protein